MYTFTPGLNLAKRYAAWTKRREGVISAVIAQIAIWNSAIEEAIESCLIHYFVQHRNLVMLDGLASVFIPLEAKPLHSVLVYCISPRRRQKTSVSSLK